MWDQLGLSWGLQCCKMPFGRHSGLRRPRGKSRLGRGEPARGWGRPRQTHVLLPRPGQGPHSHAACSAVLLEAVSSGLRHVRANSPAACSQHSTDEKPRSPALSAEQGQCVTWARSAPPGNPSVSTALEASQGAEAAACEPSRSPLCSGAADERALPAEGARPVLRLRDGAPRTAARSPAPRAALSKSLVSSVRFKKM